MGITARLQLRVDRLDLIRLDPELTHQPAEQALGVRSSHALERVPVKLSVSAPK
jgi:hypothetical protein